MEPLALPTYAQIEPVGQCNLRCQMCSIQFRQDGPPHGPLQSGHTASSPPVPCRPCSYAACPVGYTCLENVTVSQAVAAAEEVMAGNDERSLRIGTG
jgi:hypothetical protein